MNSVTFDQPNLKQIRGKVKSAIDENSVYHYWCQHEHEWKKGSYIIEIVTSLERTGNKYSCGYCGKELFFEQFKRVHHGM
jgi:predicted SprT family Zn-dependent metalloprotease